MHESDWKFINSTLCPLRRIFWMFLKKNQPLKFKVFEITLKVVIFYNDGKIGTKIYSETLCNMSNRIWSWNCKFCKHLVFYESSFIRGIHSYDKPNGRSKKDLKQPYTWGSWANLFCIALVHIHGKRFYQKRLVF